MSLNSASTSGGQQLFVIGKNFIKGFQVKFQQLKKGTCDVIWEAEADVDQEFTHNVSRLISHLVNFQLLQFKLKL